MIVITGMHRSGTSLLSLWLKEAGGRFGPDDEFYQADLHNQLGYLEENRIIDLNSRLITGFGRTGSTLAKYAGQVRYLVSTPMKGQRSRSEQLGPAMQQIATERAGMFVKDPRFCLTINEWQRWTGQVEACVVAIRHPATIVDSLYRRQRIPPRLGYRFWLRHLEPLSRLDEPQPVYVDMDPLMSGGDPTSAGLRLARHLDDVDKDKLATAFDQVFSKRLVRSRQRWPMPSKVEAVYGDILARCHD